MSDAESSLLIFDQKLKDERNYWIGRVSGDQAESNLCLDHPRGASYSRREGRCDLRINGEDYKTLIELTGNGSFLIYTTLLSALKICLFRYTGKRRVVVGSPARADARNLARNANALVMVDELDEGLSFKELLLNVRQTALDGYARQRYPFERLVKDLGLDGIDNKCPLFDVALVFKEIHGSMPDLKNDITLTFERGHNQIEGTVSFNAGLFAGETIERFARHYREVLSAALRNTAAPIGELNLLTEAERRRMAAWNSTADDYPGDECIHHLFEAQVDLTPDAVAAIFEDQELTYRGLNARANRLARRLRSLGVGPEVRVAIFVERSLDLIVAVQGIMKAGGTYLPLDPAYPHDRLAFMMEDSQAAVLLTQERLAERWAGHSGEIVCVDADSSPSVCEFDDNPNSGVTPENAAYVIYTSGSTGRPKGVMVAHRGLCNLSQAQVAMFAGRAGCRMLQFASSSFDASIFEIVMAWRVGATLYLGSQDSLLPGPRLGRFLADHAITNVTLPPSVLRAMPAASLSALRTIVVAGEACGADIVADWAGGRRFFNAYGPTEYTVWASVAECAEGMTNPPIGRPISNTQIHLLDTHLRRVPIGAPGELQIGGAGLARGYLNRADLTAERFIPNPFSAAPGARLYRSGDLARYLPDGNIQFLERIDHQIKLRGLRIELGEIEEVLRGHEGVRDAAAALLTEAEQQQLAVYVVAARGAKTTTAQLRSYLQERLPQYMVPSAFIMLEELPVTPNGKVDRRALPSPDRKRSSVEQPYVAPRTPVEELLAGAWSEVLGKERVGIHDNFFELGGHSLIGTQLLSRVRDLFQAELPLRTVFEYPTIARLAEQVESLRSVSLPLNAAPRNEALPQSFAQQRLWFLNELAPGSAAYNIPLLLQVNGSLTVPTLEQELGEIIRRHEALRTTLSIENGQPVQVIGPAYQVKLPVVDLRGLKGDEREAAVRRLAGEESLRSFDLAHGPLLRHSLLWLDGEDYRILLDMHHVVSDGWSLGVLKREMDGLYKAFYAGDPSPLSELPIQYADYAVWQRNVLHEDEVARQMAYWRPQLSGLPVLELPTDRARPPVQTHRGSEQPIVLDRSTTDLINISSSREGVTTFMTLLAAFKLLLSRYAGQQDIAVGVPIANRSRSETEDLIGFFVNTLPMRTVLSGDPSFRELLTRVRETTLGAYAHQDIPFQKLVEELQPKRDTSRSPLFQVAFVFQNAPATHPNDPLVPLTLNLQTARFDLELLLWERPEGISGFFAYNTDLFDRETIEAMASQYQTLVTRALADPGQRISAISMVTEAERRKVLVEWNATRTDYPEEKPVHQLFEEQVELHPDAIALTHESRSLTYADLNARANRLAHHLRERGVEPGAPVAIVLERSVDLVVAEIATLKCGAVYVPIDPTFPHERQAFMAADCGARVVIATKRVTLHDTLSALRIDIDDLSRDDAAEADSVTPFTSNMTAYIMYTSGSSGTPRGVMVTHRAIARLVLNCGYADFNETDRVAFCANPAFDAATMEVWAPLLNGGRIILIDQNCLLEPLKFADALERHAVTVLFLTVGLFNQYARTLACTFGGLRYLITGGDMLDPRVFADLLREGPPRYFLSAYGPTEATTYATTHLVTHVAEGARSIPLGRAISNTQVYILDADLKPAPIGVAGEIYIGGVGVAQGYLNRVELTAERFLPNPYGDEAGARMYRTGDLARWLREGAIEFLGRNDCQVKIRGFRVELGEIEAALSRHPSVDEVVVIARQRPNQDKRLTAYIVPKPGSSLSAGMLRSLLRQRLPDYMIPSAFVMRDQLPLTPNGKIDRRALAMLEEAQPEPDEFFVAPNTELERAVGAVWQEVLGIEKAGIHDNFFDLGGNSILIVQLANGLRGSLGSELSVIELFSNSTISMQVRRISESRSANQQQSEAAFLQPILDRARMREEAMAMGPDFFRQR